MKPEDRNRTKTAFNLLYIKPTRILPKMLKKTKKKTSLYIQARTRIYVGKNFYVPHRKVSLLTTANSNIRV